MRPRTPGNRNLNGDVKSHLRLSAPASGNQVFGHPDAAEHGFGEFPFRDIQEFGNRSISRCCLCLEVELGLFTDMSETQETTVVPELGARASDASPLFRQSHIWAPAKNANCCLSGGYLISEGNGTAFAMAVSDESVETAQRLYLSSGGFHTSRKARRRCHEGVAAKLI